MEKKNRRGRRGPDKIQVFKVQKDMPLFEFLLETFADRSKTTVKSYLAHRQIAVNNTPTTKFDAPLHAGDEVTINFTRGYKEFRHPRLRIVYEDEFLIVVDKGYGLLSMSTDRIKANTAYHILSDYVRRDNPANRIFILHRLDRDTSGLMMFAKKTLLFMSIRPMTRKTDSMPSRDMKFWLLTVVIRWWSCSWRPVVRIRYVCTCRISDTVLPETVNTGL